MRSFFTKEPGPNHDLLMEAVNGANALLTLVAQRPKSPRAEEKETGGPSNAHRQQAPKKPRAIELRRPGRKKLTSVPEDPHTEVRPLLIRDILFDEEIERAFVKHRQKHDGLDFPERLRSNLIDVGSFPLDTDKLHNYMHIGTQAPPIDVTTPNGYIYRLSNGRHRTLVAILRGRSTILARVHWTGQRSHGHPHHSPTRTAPAYKRKPGPSDVNGKRIGEASHPGPSKPMCKHGLLCECGGRHTHPKGMLSGLARRLKEGKQGGNAERGAPGRESKEQEVCPHHLVVDCPCGDTHWHPKRTRLQLSDKEYEDEKNAEEEEELVLEGAMPSHVPQHKMGFDAIIKEARAAVRKEHHDYYAPPKEAAAKEVKRDRAGKIGNRSNRKSHLIAAAVADAEDQAHGESDASVEAKYPVDERQDIEEEGVELNIVPSSAGVAIGEEVTTSTTPTKSDPTKKRAKEANTTNDTECNEAQASEQPMSRPPTTEELRRDQEGRYENILLTRELCARFPEDVPESDSEGYQSSVEDESGGDADAEEEDYTDSEASEDDSSGADNYPLSRAGETMHWLEECDQPAPQFKLGKQMIFFSGEILRASSFLDRMVDRLVKLLDYIPGISVEYIPVHNVPKDYRSVENQKVYSTHTREVGLLGISLGTTVREATIETLSDMYPLCANVVIYEDLYQHLMNTTSLCNRSVIDGAGIMLSSVERAAMQVVNIHPNFKEMNKLPMRIVHTVIAYMNQKHHLATVLRAGTSKTDPSEMTCFRRAGTLSPSTSEAERPSPVG